jgi:hypothetical protein
MDNNLVVDDWSQCSENYLLKNLDEKINQLNCFHNKYPNFLTNVETIKKIFIDL